MDLTPSLAALESRRRQGEVLLQGRRLVLCSSSWPLLVSQVCVLQRGPQLLGACTTEEEGLALVMTHRPELLICHDGLDQGNGLRLIRRAKAAMPELRTLLIVQEPQRFAWKQLLHLGIDAACSGTQLGRGVVLKALKSLEQGGCFIDPALRSTSPLARPQLTGREQQVLEGLQRYESTKQQAKRLGLQLSTVKGYQRQLYNKLGAHCSTQAVLLGLHNGLLQAD